MQFYIFYIQDFFMKAIKICNKKIKTMNLLKIYLLKAWFVMKPIKMKKEIGLYPDEIEKDI